MVYNGKPYEDGFLEPPICLGILASSAFQNQEAKIFAKGIHLGCRFLSPDASGKSEEFLRIPDPIY